MFLPCALLIIDVAIFVVSEGMSIGIAGLVQVRLTVLFGEGKTGFRGSTVPLRYLSGRKRFGAENRGIRRNRIRIRGKFGLSSERGERGQILLLDIPKIPQTFHILSNLSTTS